MMIRLTRALNVQDIDKAGGGDDEVLVRVRAASVDPDVWHVVVGLAYVFRFMGIGVANRRTRCRETDMAGHVESMGKNVTQFKVGDEVFGETTAFSWDNGGAFAEYVAVKQEHFALKPGNVTFEQAAAVPTSGYIAVSNLVALNKKLQDRMY